MPGIHDKNSKPLKLLLIANADSDLSLTELPAIIISSDNKEILLKLFNNFITTPSESLSVINVFEPPPKIKIFSLLLIFFKNLINSFKFFTFY